MSDSRFIQFVQAAKAPEGRSSKFIPGRNEWLSIPSEDIMIRVIDHPVFRYMQHMTKKDGKIRSTRCTRGSKLTNGKCLGCEYTNIKTGSNPPIVTTRRVLVFTVLDLRKVHTVVGSDNKKTTQPCRGRNCLLCKSTEGELSYTGRRHWTIGKGHLSIVDEANKRIGAVCLNCKGDLEVVGLTCKNCNSSIFSEEVFCNMTPRNIQEAAVSTFTCDCGHEGLPKEGLVCSGCDKPSRASIYDTNIAVQKIKGSDSNYISLSIVPTNKFEPIPKELATVDPYDFEAIFPEFSIDAQAAVLGLENILGISESVAVNSEVAAEYFKS